MGEAADIRELTKRLPCKIAAVLIVLNTEVVTVINILLFGISGVYLKAVTGTWSTVEFSYWFWFIGWLGRNLKGTKPIKDAVNLGEEKILPEVKEAGETWIARHIKKFDAESNKKKRISLLLKGSGYIFGLFLLGVTSVSPFPLAWLPGLVFCRVKNWKMGFLVMLLGNLYKNINIIVPVAEAIVFWIRSL